MRRLGFVGTAFVILTLIACSSDGKDGKDGKTGQRDGSRDGTTDGKKSGDIKDGTGDPTKEPTNAEKIVGTWEAVKGQLEPGSTVEFTNDGKLKMSIKQGEKTVREEGTYKVERETITATIKDKTETMKIQSLTGTTLVTKDEDGKLDEFKKK